MANLLSLDEKTPTANSGKMQSIQTLIIGRLMVIFVLLVTIWIWNSGRLQLSWEQSPQGLFLVFLISVGLTIIYFFLLRLIDRRYSLQVKIQFLLDSLLVTWLVWRTGDMTSPYIWLYIVLIGVSSFFLRPLWTLFMAVVSIGIETNLDVVKRIKNVKDHYNEQLKSVSSYKSVNLGLIEIYNRCKGNLKLSSKQTGKNLFVTFKIKLDDIN